jgi:hypothetical protein
MRTIFTDEQLKKMKKMMSMKMGEKTGKEDDEETIMINKSGRSN